METNYLTIDDLRHRRELTADSVLNVIVSAYPNVRTSTPYRHPDGSQKWLNLGSALLDPAPAQLAALQERIRAGQGDKSNMLSFTPSGFFEPTRAEANLKHHTRLIAFDIDAKDNAGRLRNFDRLQYEIAQIPYTAYCGRSVSGKGLWGLFAIPRTDAAKNHKRHFAAMQEDFAAMGVIIDPACADVSRVRFYSHDPDAYVNHYPRIYDRLYIAPPAPKPTAKAYAAPRERIGETSAKASEVFNSLYKPIDILTAHGWKVKRTSATQTHLTRPEAKTNGNDATIYHDVEKVKVFSTSAGIKTEGEHCAFGLFALLEHAGDWREAAKAFWNTHSVGAR